MRLFFVLFFLLFFTSFGYGQLLEWKAGVHGFVDNREYGKSGKPSPTIFGMRFSPEIGLRIDSVNRIRIGFNSLHNLGDRHNFAKKIDPVIYYNYRKKAVDFYIGAFPRHSVLADFPKAILSDTLHYFRPNMEGFLLTYSTKHLSQQIWIDWTSKQTAIDREAFLIGGSGIVKPEQFYFSYFFTLWHYALPEGDATDIHIRDNLSLLAKAGIDLSKKTFLDSLDVNVGALISFDRLRNVYDWRKPKGLLLESYLSLHSFFLRDTWYIGEAQDIGYGDGFYNAKHYNRLDIGWTALKYNYLEATLSMSFHFSPGAMDNQQTFSLRYNFGGNVPIKKHGKFPY